MRDISDTFKQVFEDEGVSPATANQWVGLFHVKQVHDTTYFGNRPPSIGFVTGSSIADPVGFAYDPLPNHPMGYKAVQVGKSWYSYED